MIWISNANHIYCWGANHLKKHKRSNNARFNLSLNRKWLVSFFPFLPCFFFLLLCPIWNYSHIQHVQKWLDRINQVKCDPWNCDCDCAFWCDYVHESCFFLFRVWYGVTEKKEKKKTELFFCVDIFTQNLSKCKTKQKDRKKMHWYWNLHFLMAPANVHNQYNT